MKYLHRQIFKRLGLFERFRSWNEHFVDDIGLTVVGCILPVQTPGATGRRLRSHRT